MKNHSKIDRTKILITIGSFTQVESIAECSTLENSGILLTCIKRFLALKTNLCFLRVVVLHTGFTVVLNFRKVL